MEKDKIKGKSYYPRVLKVDDPRDAAAELRAVGVDPGGLERMLPKAVFHLIRLQEVPVKAAVLIKQSLLSRGGDAAVSRQAARLGDELTDVLIMGAEGQIREALATLKMQPFGLPALAREVTAALDASLAQGFPWTIAGRRYDLTERVMVMGILNVTPDSFSDGGLYNGPEAVDRALQMIAEGADIIDIGGESTRPGSAGVSARDEISRVLPVIEALQGRAEIPISVDTRKAEVAEAALKAGAVIVNDISGLTYDPRLAEVTAAAGASLVVMHMRGTPETMNGLTDYPDLMGEIVRSLSGSIDRAVEAGIPRERIAVDPGIGFAKNFSQNMEIIRRLHELSALERPLLVGVSRKAFIGSTLGLPPQERLEGTAAVTALAVAGGASIIRAHEVRSMVRVCRMAFAVARGRESGGD